MLFNVCSQDPIAYRTLPYLGRPDLLSLRLVNSTFRDAVDLLVRDTRGWMNDPIAPRGGVLVRRALQTVPRSLNDMQYVFRVFQRSFSIANSVYQGLLGSSDPDSLGISLESAEGKSDRMKFMCMNELFKALSKDVRWARSLDLIKDCHSYEEACSVLIRDARTHPTVLDCLVVLHMVQMVTVRQLEPSSQVMDDLLGYWLSLSPRPIPCHWFQNFFVDLAQFGHAPYLDRLMKSSRKDELWEVLYEALEAAKKNHQLDSQDLLSSYIQKRTHKSYLIGQVALRVFFMAHVLIIPDRNPGLLTWACSLGIVLGNACMAQGLNSLRGMTLGPRIRMTGLGTPAFHSSVVTPNSKKVFLLTCIEAVYPLCMASMVALRHHPMRSSAVKIAANLGLSTLIYGALTACKMPRASRTLVGRNIYPIAAGVHGLIHFALQGKGLEKIGPAALGALFSAGHFYLSRATLFL